MKRIIKVGELSFHNQLKQNQKGGLLNGVLEFIEDNIPQINTIICTNGALYIKDNLTCLLKEQLDNEFDKVNKEKKIVDQMKRY